MILNGEWELDGKSVQVPFPPQSELSGFQGEVGEELVYRKTFTLPESFTKDRVLLHFGAVDQVCEVWLNGQQMKICAGKGGLSGGTGKEETTSHEGGYLPFMVDITEAVKWTEKGGKNHAYNGEKVVEKNASDTENLLEIRVTDTLSEVYPYGKQRKKRGGMWYTPVSGIWQTVWLENVPREYISKVILTPDLEGVDVEVLLTLATGRRALESNASGDRAETIAQSAGTQPAFHQAEVIVTLENGEEIRRAIPDSMQRPENAGDDNAVFAGVGNGNLSARISLADYICADGTPYKPILWTPENPHLYTMKILYGEDCVETYFALRTIEIQKVAGINRVCLNDKPIFMHAVLDQGYFPEGIYLPKEEEEYERDILRMKSLGYNMLRKHIKVEPECFYYYCDVHGMLVMQDMVNNGHYSYIPQTVLPTIGFKKRKDIGGLFLKERWGAMSRTEEPLQYRKSIFRQHTRDTIAHLYNHPCIIAYTVFNEGWGQFDSDSLYEEVKELDPTRLVDSTSGWFAQKKSDFDSEHIYFRAETLKPGIRPMFLSECGGFSLAVEGHRFNTEKSYGYGACKDREELTERILDMYRKMVLPAIEKGLCGCVYTQLSDVEDEINGLYTYDRQVCKVVEDKFVELAAEIERRIRK